MPQAGLGIANRRAHGPVEVAGLRILRQHGAAAALARPFTGDRPARASDDPTPCPRGHPDHRSSGCGVRMLGGPPPLQHFSITTAGDLGLWSRDGLWTRINLRQPTRHDCGRMAATQGPSAWWRRHGHGVVDRPVGFPQHFLYFRPDPHQQAAFRAGGHSIPAPAAPTSLMYACRVRPSPGSPPALTSWCTSSML